VRLNKIGSQMDQSVALQDAVFKFLGDAATYAGGEVRRIDTHAAAVFLAGDRAYKVKRAVRFPFLDYSTLAKRKAACLAELEVNQPYAPELYRRIVPITRGANGQLAIDGQGEPIEWAVEMVRFDENQTLDRLAETKGIDDALADKLAVTVTQMHARAPIVDLSPWLTAIGRYIEQATAAFQDEPALFPADAVLMLDQALRSSLNRHRSLLMNRGRSGLVRRGHGDLHLGNIAFLNGNPVPFDAIEFDPMIASGDVLYDLAFLLMDLIERRLDRAANVILNRYFTETSRIEDLDGLAALPFFMSLRAAIRAEVTAARLKNVDSTAQPAVRKSAKAYFDLAVELMSPPVPRYIAIGGLSGTGKSSLARALAPLVTPRPGAMVIRSDVERKHLFGVAETAHLPDDAYRSEANAQVYNILTKKAARIIAAGHSVIVDAVFAKSDERSAIAAASVSANIAFHGIFLVADLKTRLNRVGGRNLDASDADTKIARQQETLALRQVDWSEVDASGLLKDTLALARAVIE
jgi:aminoglycoside phosphotransferase family enzyme/predicted kinase